jgi:DNA-binding transcriptional MocR family regulator
VTDLSLNLPPHLEPDVPAQALAATLEELSKSLDVGSLLKYQDNAGMELHRQAGASWVSQRVADADPEKLVVTNGVQHAISVLLSTLAAPGDVVMTEELTYPAFRSAAEHLSLTVRGIEMDEDGIRVDAFRRACKAGARVLYITPTLHNPTTISMSSGRRAALARSARECDVQIIEDDVYGILVDDAPPPLATYAPERTYFLSSLTKAVAGGLRIGYVLCPTAADAERVAAGVRITTWMAAPLMAHIASRWVRSKTARDILRANRAEAMRRQALAARLLSGFKWHATRFSYHGWLELPAGWTTAEFVAQARRARVAVTPGDAFAVSGRCEPPAVRLSLTAADDRDSLEDALGRVARLLELGPRATATVM